MCLGVECFVCFDAVGGVLVVLLGGGCHVRLVFSLFAWLIIDWLVVV